MLNRRRFLSIAAAALSSSCSTAAAVERVPRPRRIRALAFDAFAIFDPRPVSALADAMFPGSGLAGEWRTRQFEYTWLRVAAHHYADFWQVTGDALMFAAARLKLTLSSGDRDRLMHAYLALNAWPDVIPALESFKRSRHKLALLSNFTAPMLDANIRSAGLTGVFDQVISTDTARTYKPDPRAYRLGVRALGMTQGEILFVPFAGWDAAGASLFGYPTYWVNRLRLPPEQLGPPPDASGETLGDLAAFLQ